jgi:rSAM/selenodomain-associated transferase 1
MTLVIMAKAARAGSVKTRLAACLEPGAILELYRCLLEDTMVLARSLDGVTPAIMSPAGDVDDLRRIADGTMQVVAQKGAGLAAGLDSVFAHFCGNGGGRTVAFNSDTPHLAPAVLRQAFDVLGTSDVVVGPTPDGGYYLVGAKAPHRGLFAASAMGTTSALDTLLERARELRLSVGFTEECYDVDVSADLERLAEELRAAPERAPRTAQWLAGR